MHTCPSARHISYSAYVKICQGLHSSFQSYWCNIFLFSGAAPLLIFTFPYFLAERRFIVPQNSHSTEWPDHQPPELMTSGDKLPYYTSDKKDRTHCQMEGQHGGDYTQLTHWGRDKMAAIFQTTFSNVFSSTKMYEFRLRFHWSLFPKVQLTIAHHWFR